MDEELIVSYSNDNEIEPIILGNNANGFLLFRHNSGQHKLFFKKTLNPPERKIIGD